MPAWLTSMNTLIEPVRMSLLCFVETLHIFMNSFLAKLAFSCYVVATEGPTLKLLFSIWHFIVIPMICVMCRDSLMLVCVLG